MHNDANMEGKVMINFFSPKESNREDWEMMQTPQKVNWKSKLGPS